MHHDDGTFKGFGGLDLYTQRWQPSGETRAVLAIVHGFGEHSGRYPNIVNRLVPKGYAVYGFDHRGHGRSPGQRGYIKCWDEFRQDVHQFLAWARAQEPDRPLFLMGHSMGGLIALEYTLREPEGLRGVIASAPLLAQAGVSPVLFTLSRLMSRIWPTLSMSTGLDASTISRDPAVVQAYVSDPLVHSLGTPRLATEIAAAIAWTHAHAGDLRVPLLLFYGSADRLAPPEGSRAFFDHVTLADKERHEYEGYFHETHNDVGWERPVSDLEDWLERHL